MALEFLVRNQRLKLFSGGPVVADSQQYLKARFTFSEDWQGTRKYAQFRRDGEVYTCNIDEYGEVEVPWETLVGKGVVQISAFATNQQDETNKLITTNPVFVKVETSGIKETELPKTPSLGILGDSVDESLKEITDARDRYVLQMTEIRDVVLEAKDHIDQTDYKIYVGETAPSEDITNAMVWINPAEDDGGSDELAEAVAAAQNAANAAEKIATDLGLVDEAVQTAVSTAEQASNSATTANNKADIATAKADIATTKASEASASADTATQKAEAASTSATNAAQSYTNADAVATQLTEYLATKETLTAPAVDKTLLIEGAAADSKVVGTLKNALDDFKTNQPNLFMYSGVNILDESLLIDGKRLGSDGNISELASACATESFIDISDIKDSHLGAYYTTPQGVPIRSYYMLSFYSVADISGHLQTYRGESSANLSKAICEIPDGANYVRVSYSVLTTSSYHFMLISGNSNMELVNYERYYRKVTIVPKDLNDILNKYTFETYPHHEDNAVLTISKLRNSFTFNQNDFTFVKDELWLAKHNSNDFSNGTGIFRHKWDGAQFVHIGTINCDFGHWNVVDYCEANDCLIFGNGANDYETEGNYFVVVPHPLELGDTALIADVGIKYNVNIGYKVQALWGDSNLGENNIAVLLSNNLQTIVKVLLKRDSSGNFNGEFIELERKENLPVFGIQGADIWNNTLYVGGAESSGMYTINKVSLSDYSSVKNSVKYYKDDGTPYLGVVQGVHVGGDYVWIFVNTDAPQTGKCCFLTKYRR